MTSSQVQPTIPTEDVLLVLLHLIQPHQEQSEPLFVYRGIDYDEAQSSIDIDGARGRTRVWGLNLH